MTLDHWQPLAGPGSVGLPAPAADHVAHHDQAQADEQGAYPCADDGQEAGAGGRVFAGERRREVGS